MKKTLYIIAAIGILLCACNSKEKKAEAVIREHLSKTLYDFESYEPIETTVTKAKSSIFTDTTIWNLGSALAYAMQENIKIVEETLEMKEKMDIWEPTSYSSSYTWQQYHKYKNNWENAALQSLQMNKICESLISEIKDSISNIDTTKDVGWEVKHRFRCKNKKGIADIGEYRYVLDDGFKQILIEDSDRGYDKKTHELLDTINEDKLHDYMYHKIKKYMKLYG